MAIVHFSYTTGTRLKGKSGRSHFRYICRLGEEKFRKEVDLRHVEHGVYPQWASHNPQIFWEAADSYEGKNRRLYTELRLGLPRELTDEQQVELVRDFIRVEIGDNAHAYTFAVHAPKALDGKLNPHAHIMMTERMYDGIERSPEQFFKRANTKCPEKGGTAKDPDWNRKEKVAELRQAWGEQLNRALEIHGHEVRVDVRSLKDQGIERAPEPKLGSAQVSLIREGIITERAQLVLQARKLRKAEENIHREQEKRKALNKVLTRYKIQNYRQKSNSNEKKYTVPFERVMTGEVLSLVKEEKEKFYDALEQNERQQFEFGGYVRKSDRRIVFNPTKDSWLQNRREVLVDQNRELEEKLNKLKSFEKELLLAGKIILDLRSNHNWTTKESILNKEYFEMSVNKNNQRLIEKSQNQDDREISFKKVVNS